jgi:hypothetical protein
VKVRLQGRPEDCMAAVEALSRVTNVVVPPRMERRYASVRWVYVTTWVQLDAAGADSEGEA